MKSKFLLTLITILLTLTLSGCFPSNDKYDKNSSSIKTYNIQDTPKHIKKELDKNLLIDADIEIPSNLNFNIYNAKLKTYNLDNLQNIFFKNKSIVEKQTRVSQKSTNFTDTWYTFDDGYSLYLFQDRFNFNTKISHDYITLLGGTTSRFRDDMTTTFPQNSISNLKKDDARKLAIDACKDLDLPISSNPIVYALDSNSLNKAENSFMSGKDEMAKKKRREWNLNNEAYLIILNCEKDALPIFSNFYETSSSGSYPILGSQIVSIIDKNGFIMFESKGIYDITSINQKNVQISPVTQTLEVVKQKFKNIKLTSPLTITNAALQYLPRPASSNKNEFIMVPSWILSTEQNITSSNSKSDISYKKIDNIIIDATTGKEVK